jgi:hypothetical protein
VFRRRTPRRGTSSSHSLSSTDESANPRSHPQKERLSEARYSGVQSINSGFGSGVMAGDTGILLNNRMSYWHLEPGHPNRLQPGRRVRHTMNPPLVLKDGALWCVFGTPGGICSTTASRACVYYVRRYSVFSYAESSFREIYLASVGVQHFPKEVRPADLVGGEPVFIS